MKISEKFNLDFNNDISNEICFDKFDFAAISISGWHLSVVYSYLLSINKEINGIIFINSNRITEEMLVDIDGINITYIDINKLTYNKRLKYLFFLFFSQNKINGKDFWLLTPYGYNLSFFAEMRKLFKNKNIHIIKFDEGIGSYLSELDFNMFGNQNSRQNIIKKIKIKIKLKVKKFLINKLKNNMYDLNDFFLFNKTKNGLVENQETLRYLREFYKEYANYTLNYKKNQILIFKDYDSGRIKKKDIILFYEQLISLLSSYNKTIYIKKHPYDNESTFNETMNKIDNVELIENSLDAEMIFSYLEPEMTFGGVSTCCFSIPIIFNTPVYNFSNLYKKYEIVPILKKEIELRKCYFPNDNRIIFLNSYKEISSLLK